MPYGKPFAPSYRNGILSSRKCPNCRLRSLHRELKPKGVVYASELNKGAVKSKKRAKTGVDKRLDDTWSKLVKVKFSAKCAVCGNMNSLNSHHIYSRAKMSLRWSLLNGICLCVGHHIGVRFSAHKTPVEFNEWLVYKMGVKFMDELKLIAHVQSNLHEFEKEILLKELQSELKKLTA